jgi:hypothetical protein
MRRQTIIVWVFAREAAKTVAKPRFTLAKLTIGPAAIGLFSGHIERALGHQRNRFGTSGNETRQSLDGVADRSK